jgi:hypothetical protein
MLAIRFGLGRWPVLLTRLSCIAKIANIANIANIENAGHC